MTSGIKISDKSAGVGLGSHTVGDFLGDDIKLIREPNTNNVSVEGTLKYVSSFPEFNISDDTEQKGNYFPFTITETGSRMTLKKNGVASEGKSDLPFDSQIIYRISDDNKNDTFTIEVDGKDIVNLKFANTKLSPAPIALNSKKTSSRKVASTPKK